MVKIKPDERLIFTSYHSESWYCLQRVCLSVCLCQQTKKWLCGWCIAHHINGCDFLAEFVELSLQNAVNMIALQSLEMQRCRHKTWLYYVTVEQ